jgi:hypothetical protein
MSANVQLPLKVVDAAQLRDNYRNILTPGRLVEDRLGYKHRLPRFFFEVPSWKAALDTPLTAHFALWEFMSVDLHEDHLMQTFPRYVPCAVTVLAAHLELFRTEVNTYVRIAANGGYRSPGHALSHHASTHNWATAANIYRIGGDYLDDESKIDRFRAIAGRVLPSAWLRPYGDLPGHTTDHLHIDLGFVTVSPRNISEE